LAKSSSVTPGKPERHYGFRVPLEAEFKIGRDWAGTPLQGAIVAPGPPLPTAAAAVPEPLPFTAAEFLPTSIEDEKEVSYVDDF
jgi:hypothetical protein